eukprot:g2777.t1
MPRTIAESFAAQKQAAKEAIRTPFQRLTVGLLVLLFYAQLISDGAVCVYYRRLSRAESSAQYSSLFMTWHRQLLALILLHAFANAFMTYLTTGTSRCDVLRSLCFGDMLRETCKSFREKETSTGFAAVLLFGVGIQTVPGCIFQLYTLFQSWDRWEREAKKGGEGAAAYDTLVYSCATAMLFATMTAFVHNENVFNLFMNFYCDERADDEEKKKRRGSRVFLFVYCALDIAIRVLLFATAAVAFGGSGVWTMLAAALTARCWIFVRYQRDNQTGRFENIVIGFFLGVPSFCASLLLVEDHGTRPLILVQRVAMLETLVIGLVTCSATQHPLPPQFKCACGADLIDLSIYAMDCRNRAMDPQRAERDSSAMWDFPMLPAAYAGMWIAACACFYRFGGYAGRESSKQLTLDLR